jgi:NAD(P)H-hydrate epimerase
MEILTGSQMRRVDERAIRERGLPGIDLMEAAGSGVAAALVEEIPDLTGRRVVVLCGKGNNGGDGFVAARHLAAAGASTEVAVLARVDDLRGDAATCARRAIAAGLLIREIPDERTWASTGFALDRGALVVDALLGTGAQGGARALAASVIQAVGTWPATVISIDVPSGVDSDTGRVEGPAIRARRTYTLCRPKLCLVLEPAASHAGTWRTIDIGIPDDDVAAERSTTEWLDLDAAARLMPERPEDAHKGTMGHLLVVAGSRGKSGAASLVSLAAMRSGVGLVTAAVPRGVQSVVAASRAEVMTEALPETRGGALARTAAARVRALAETRDALALGPGLGTGPETRAAVRAILARGALATVIDADGLNALAADRRGRRLPPGAFVLTPHPGEAGRLLGISAAEIQGDRMGAALRLARETGAIVVLKGRRSIVVRPDGRVAFNASGNPGMATGGSGDALTGVIGALLARGLEAFDAARLGTYVHGAAGDLAAERLGEEGMIAGDLVAALPGAWRAVGERRRGESLRTLGA